MRAGRAYREQLEQLRQAAAQVYRDPAKAVERIEATLLKSKDGEKVAAVLEASPERAGALRGSDRLLDGLKARQERQEALAGIRGLSVATAQLGRMYRLGLERAVDTETRRQQRSVAPALTPKPQQIDRAVQQEQQRSRGPSLSR